MSPFAWLLLIAFLVLSPAIVGAIAVLKFSYLNVERVDETNSEEIFSSVQDSPSIDVSKVGEFGLQPLGVFRVLYSLFGAHLAVWQRGSEQTFLCVCVITRLPLAWWRLPAGWKGAPIGIEIISNFDPGSLTTANHREGHGLPQRRGYFQQTFTRPPVADLWSHHLTGLEYICSATGQKPATTEIDFCNFMVASVRDHMAYIRSLPFWYVRILYWHYVRRYMLHNRTMAEQYEDDIWPAEVQVVAKGNSSIT